MRFLPLMLAGFALVTATHSLDAQTSTDTATAVFHQGEWGVGFFIGSGVTDAGVLRFSTPTRAWVLDGTASVDRQTQSVSTMFGEQTERSWYVNGQFGPRWYQAMSAHVARFVGLGVLASYGRADFQGSSSSGSIWTLGAYGEAGMQYMLTRYLGLGGRATLSASRNDSKNVNEAPQGFTVTSKSTSYHLGLNAVSAHGHDLFLIESRNVLAGDVRRRRPARRSE